MMQRNKKKGRQALQKCIILVLGPFEKNVFGFVLLRMLIRDQSLLNNGAHTQQAFATPSKKGLSAALQQKWKAKDRKMRRNYSGNRTFC